jgi:AraC-like DNA-binding protein
MLYREVPPAPRWEGMIASFWEFVVSETFPPGHLHTIPVDGCVSIRYAPTPYGPRTAFLGPRLKGLQVPVTPGDRSWGVRFLPGASRAAIGKSGSDWRDAFGPLAPELPQFASEIEQLMASVQGLEEAISVFESLIVPSEPCPITSAAVIAIAGSHGTAKIAELPAQIGVSERQFLRRFRDEVGLTPKQFARVCRFRAAGIAALRDPDANWGEIAAEQGFADQAHLTHEFIRLFGSTPGEFKSRFLPRIEHRM